MSILNSVPNQPTQPNANVIANQMKIQARNIYNTLVRSFNEGAKNFWTNPHFTPEQLASALGKDGKELFELHAKIGQLLGSINAEAITEGLSVIGQCNYNNDGYVIVVPKSTTTVEPTTTVAPQ